MNVDAFSFVLGALSVLVVVVFWCWVRGPRRVVGIDRLAVLSELARSMPVNESDEAAVEALMRRLRANQKATRRSIGGHHPKPAGNPAAQHPPSGESAASGVKPPLCPRCGRRTDVGVPSGCLCAVVTL